MNIRSPTPNSEDRRDPWGGQLDAIEAADRRMMLTDTLSTAAIAFWILLELMRFVVALPFPMAAVVTDEPTFRIVAGTVAVACTCYIAWSLHRRRREVVRNDIRSLRQQIAQLTARGALASDGAPSGASL
jgi:hypothetical protein